MLELRRPRAFGAVGISAAAMAMALFLGATREIPAVRVLPPVATGPAPGDDLARLQRSLEAQRPRGVFLTVDTVSNRLLVRRGSDVLREAICSTGTGSVLEDPRTGRRWVFATPRGVRRILAKRRDPVWTRPDWSYIEEGTAPPNRNSERLDQDTLGDWALDLGDGYMIHGTLFQRYLGRSVTHGCIRLGDQDLDYVAGAVPVGAVVMLY